MNIGKKIEKKLKTINEGETFAYKDLSLEKDEYQSAAKSIERLIKKGIIKRVSPGIFFKPKQTIFGELLPSTSLMPFFLLMIFTISSARIVIAQDVHFSQFESAPLLINPANTGDFSGNYRVSNNFRSQWYSFANPGYNSLSLSYDKQLNSKIKNLSLGGQIVYDKSGTVGMTISKLYLSSSYKKVSGKNIYIFGVQAGAVLQQFNNDNAI